jgi:hypothetical protein
MEHIAINIRTSGAAFEDSPTSEIARILRKLADQFENDGIPAQTLRDVNGNTCGSVAIESLKG